MTAGLFYNSQQRVVLLAEQNTERSIYVQHIRGTIDAHTIDNAEFLKQHKPIPNHKPIQDIAQKLLDSTKDGIVVTPAARLQLSRLLTPNITQEATMAVPTTTKKKKSPQKERKEELPLASAKIMSGPGAASTKAPRTPFIAAVKKQKTEEVKSEVATEEVKSEVATEEVKSKILPVEPDTSRPECLVSEVEAKAQKLIEDAKAEAERMVSEAKQKLATAQKLFNDKKILEAARLTAEKIRKDTEKECAGILASIKALTGKESKVRKGTKKGTPTASEGSIKRPRVDISGKKIKQLSEPIVRGESERGLRALAVYKSKTTDEALGYEGVTASFVLKLVADGCIELV